MNIARGFRRTELRLTGIYLAQRWIAQVRKFPRPSEYVSWFEDEQQSGQIRRDFVEFAAGAIEEYPHLAGGSNLNWFCLLFSIPCSASKRSTKVAGLTIRRSFRECLCCLTRCARRWCDWDLIKIAPPFSRLRRGCEWRKLKRLS